MREIAIVGLGWFGRPLAEQLQKKGFLVKGTTTSIEKRNALEKSAFDVSVLNLSSTFNEPEVKYFFSNCELCVINIPPGKAQFQSYQSQCEKLVSLFSADCHFIFVSSTSVYADDLESAIEDSNVLSHYQFSSQLYLTEKRLQTILKERLTVLRFAGLLGPERNLARYFAGKKGLLNGSSPVNLLHLEDAIQSVEKVISTEQWGKVFNICSPKHPTREEFYLFLCEKSGFLLPDFAKSLNPTKSKVVSSEKSILELGMEYSYTSPFEFTF